MHFNINRQQQKFTNSLGEKVVYTINENDFIEYLCIAETEIRGCMSDFTEQGFDVRISLVNGNASIGVYHVDDDKDALASDSTTLKNLTIQKFVELIERAKKEQGDKDQEKKDLQRAMKESAQTQEVDKSKKSEYDKAMIESMKTWKIENSQPLIDKENGWKVRGDGRCFITAVLYQKCKQYESPDETSLKKMGFYGKYDSQSTAVKQIEGLYKKFFQTHSSSDANTHEAPDVDLMKDFLEKKLCIGIKVNLYDSNNEYFATLKNNNTNSTTLKSNNTNSITVALLTNEEHIVLPETIEAMKGNGHKNGNIQVNQSIVQKSFAQNPVRKLNVPKEPVLQKDLQPRITNTNNNMKVGHLIQKLLTRQGVVDNSQRKDIQGRKVAQQIEEDRIMAQQLHHELNVLRNQNAAQQNNRERFFNKRQQKTQKQLNVLRNQNAAQQNNRRLAVQPSVFPNKAESQMRLQGKLPAINGPQYQQDKVLQADAERNMRRK